MDQGGRAVIEIVTALVHNQHGRVLLVRKRGTESFMQPGGKREPGQRVRDTIYAAKLKRDTILPLALSLNDGVQAL
jgi:hypothetical protein